jgi:hypothetical protein
MPKGVLWRAEDIFSPRSVAAASVSPDHTPEELAG